MSKILQQPINCGKEKILAPGFNPISLSFQSGQTAIVKFSNGQEVKASCLRCPTTPCATFSEDEVVSSTFPHFPADRNTDVCPAGAIAQSNGNGAPIIDVQSCIFCGVCASRCPVGAISLVPNKGAIIEDAPNIAFVEVGGIFKSSNLDLIKKFKGLNPKGSMLEENDLIVAEAFARLQRAWKKKGDRFPNLLVRNLLIGAGVESAIGRKGDTNIRMDVVFSAGTKGGVAEVEFGGEAVLDAPRNILDALAVLASRYNWQLKESIALIVSDVLPNRRSEYWSIIQDIDRVLEVRVQTITVLALFLFNWNRKRLEDFRFYVDRDTKSYRTDVLEKIFGRKLRLGATPTPEVDIAK